MLKNKNNDVKYIQFAIPILIILLIMAMFEFVIKSVNVVSNTNGENFAYAIKIRDTIEEIDKIVERSEVNILTLTDTISETYDISKLNDFAYNKEYINKIDANVKSALINSPGINGVWFQLNIDIPFSNMIYDWQGFQNGKLVRFTKYDDRRLNPEDDKYYFETVKNKALTWSDVYTDMDNGVKMISICVPIYKYNKLIGVAGIDISIENLQQALKNMQSVFANSEIFLLDSNNRLVISQLLENEEGINDPYLFLPLFKKSSILKGNSPTKMIEFMDDGIHKTAIMVGLSNKYNIVVTFPNSEVFKGFNQLFVAIYFVFFVLALLAILAYFNKKNILKINKDLVIEKYKLRTIFDSSPNIVLIKDLNGVYIDCNTKFLEVMNIKKYDLIGKKDEDLFPPELVKDILLNDMIATKSGKTVVAESTYIDGYGNNMIVEKYIVPLHDTNGEVFCLFILALDITSKKHEQELLLKAKDDAEKAAEIKSNFLANMSHEIRTPMNGVIGFIQLLKETNLTDEQIELISAAENASDLFLSVINDILDFSKIEADKLKLENVSFDIRTVVEDVTIMGTTLAEEKNVDVNSLICSDIPRKVFGDPARLKQILTNLVGNAIKFTHQGEVIIYVKLIAHKENIAKIRFEVKDTGIGISKDKLDLIFDPFTQSDSSTTRKYGGSGLGLAICKKIIDMKGGTINVESELGKGSTFFVDLSFNVDMQATDEYKNSVQLIDGAKILVVDRNATDQKIIRYYLNESNCVIYEATNPVNAISILSAANIDISIILIDHKIQNETNFSSIIRRNNNWKDIPLVLYTSFAHKKYFNKVDDNEFKGYLRKPIKKHDLIETISNILNDNHDSTIDSFLKNKSIKKFDSNAKVLVVEDSDLNCKLIAKILEKHGLSFDIVNNGMDAIDAFRKNAYDVILMDCQMPILNGYEATKQIREIEGNTSHIPIIAITANALAKDEIKCHDFGMDDYVSKPIKIDSLLKILSKYLEPPENDNFSESIVGEIDKEDFFKNKNFVIDDIVKNMVEELGVDEDDAVQFLIQYIEFIPEIVSDFDLAVEKGDFVDLKAISHKLKGASANLRITKIAKLAAELESIALSSDVQSCINIIDEIKSSFDEFDETFKNSRYAVK